jgi:hypothetical protein
LIETALPVVPEEPAVKVQFVQVILEMEALNRAGPDTPTKVQPLQEIAPVADTLLKTPYEFKPAPNPPFMVEDTIVIDPPELFNTAEADWFAFPAEIVLPDIETDPLPLFDIA